MDVDTGQLVNHAWLVRQMRLCRSDQPDLRIPASKFYTVSLSRSWSLW